MIIYIEITAASVVHDQLVFSGKAQPASWRPVDNVHVAVPDTVRNKRAFSVGKVCRVDIRPTKRKAR